MKIENLDQLRREKKRLKEECKNYEQDIKKHINYVQENAGALAMEGFIQAIPKINIKKIVGRIFKHYTDKVAEKNVAAGLAAKVLPLGIAFGMKYFKKLFKK